MMLLAPLKLITNWEQYQIYIAEMGIDSPIKPNNMEYLLSILEPTIGVYTSQSSVHAEAFDFLVKELRTEHRGELMRKAIGQEKVKLLLSLPESGTAVYCGDDELICELAHSARAKHLTFGEKSGADVECKHLAWESNSTRFVVRHGDEFAEIKIKHYWLPKHYGSAFGAAVAVGLTLGIDLATCAKRIERHFSLPPGRASLFPAINQATILDSSYNSSTQSVLDFFDMLEAIRASAKTNRQTFPKRIIGLLGDMREIGLASQVEHEKVARHMVSLFDEVVLVGPQMQKFVLPILKKNHIPVQSVLSSSEAGTILKQIIQPNDLIFAKGSQNTIFLERALKKILDPRLDPKQTLCRQESYWRVDPS